MALGDAKPDAEGHHGAWEARVKDETEAALDAAIEALRRPGLLTRILLRMTRKG